MSLRRCNILNPATLLPLPDNDSEDDEFDRDCLSVTELCTKPRPDILDVPLEEPDHILFVDCTCLSVRHRILRAVYAACTTKSVVEAFYLCNITSAQVAELIA